MVVFQFCTGSVTEMHILTASRAGISVSHLMIVYLLKQQRGFLDLEYNSEKWGMMLRFECALCLVGKIVRSHDSSFLRARKKLLSHDED